MKEQPILGYDWEMGHEEIKLEIGTYYTGKGLYIGMLAKEDGVWESFSDLTVNLPFERSDVHEAFIQDFGSKEKLKFIQKHKLGKILPERGHSGFCTYAARHTWATMAYHCEIHPGIISEAMGHSSITVTETYLKPFSNRKIDEANQRVISFVRSGACTV